MTWGELIVLLLLLHIKPAEVAQFQLPPGQLPREVFQASPTLSRPSRKTQDRHEGLRLACERLGVLPDEEVTGVSEVWVSLLRLFPP